MDAIKNFQKLDIKTKKMISSFDAWNFKSLFKWKGLEFAEYKEYETWEDSKDIDWLVSARGQKILTKIYNIDKSIKVFFLLDLRNNMNFGFEKKKIDSLLEIFFLLALSSIENSDKVWAIIFKEDDFKIFQAKRWKSHIFNIYKEILNFTNNLKIKKNENNLQNMILFLNQIKLKNNFLFILTDEMDVINDKNLKVLSLKNDIVYINIFDNFENTLEINENNLWIMWFKSKLWDTLNIDLNDDEKKENYKKYRQEKIKKLSNYLNKLWISYLKIDNFTNIYKEFFYFFKLK